MSSTRRVGRNAYHRSPHQRENARQGDYGGIPWSEYQRQTEYSEDAVPEELQDVFLAHDGSPYDYARTVLKDRSAENITLESHQPRSKEQAKNRSTRRLNFMYDGTATGKRPDHSDQFLGITSKEVRGTTTDPDMQKILPHSHVRAQNTNFYSDEDYTVSARHRHNGSEHHDRKMMHLRAKKTLDVFSTGLEGRHVGQQNKPNNDSKLSMVVGTQEVPLGELQSNEYSNKVRHSSTMGQLGWRSVSDHVYKTSAYAKIFSNIQSNNLKGVAAINRQENDHRPVRDYADVPFKVPQQYIVKANLIKQTNTNNMDTTTIRFGDSNIIGTKKSKLWGNSKAMFLDRTGLPSTEATNYVYNRRRDNNLFARRHAFDESDDRYIQQQVEIKPTSRARMGTNSTRNQVSSRAPLPSENYRIGMNNVTNHGTSQSKKLLYQDDRKRSGSWIS